MQRKFDAWLEAEQDRFILFAPAFMAAGVAWYFSLRAEPPLWPALVVGGVAAGLACVVRDRAIARGLALCLLAATVGFGSATLATRRAPPWDAIPRSGVTILGRAGLVETLPAGRRVTIMAPSLDGAAPLARHVRIRLRATDRQDIGPGDRIQVRALLSLPSPPDYPGGWDTQRDAFFGGIAGYGFAIGQATRDLAAPASTVDSLRGRIAARVMAGLPGEEGAVAATLLTGLGAAIAPADRAAFQNAGLAHLLAVAGLHIGIVMGLVFGAVRLGLAACEWTALHWPTRKIAAASALAAGGCYLVLTGSHVPILRSFVMATLVTIAVFTGRRAVSLRALGLAAGALMLAAPQEVMGVSFQMSFSAVLALIAGYEALRPYTATLGAGRWWRRPAFHVASLAMTSLLAGTASLPFAAYHFGRATLWYVPANLAAVPLTAFWVMPWGLASLALMPFGLEHLALAPMGLGLRGVIWLADTVSAWPMASLSVPQMPAWGAALSACGLVWLCLWRTRLRLASLPVLAAGILSPALASQPDVVVTPDAAIVAIREAGRVSVEQGARVTTFAREAPERVWGTVVGAAPACKTALCRVAIHGRTAALVHDPSGLDCQDLAFLVSASSLHDKCPLVPRIDRQSVWFGGAASAWITAGGATILTDRETRGDRPWVLGYSARYPPARAE